MKKLFFVLVLSALCASSFATEYYVNFGKGNDSNNGTSETTPFKTFDKVDGLNLQGGDIINVCGYGEAFLTYKSGSEGNPITIRPYESAYGGVTYKGCTLNASDNYAVTLTGCSYITVDGARKSDGAVGYIEFRQPVRIGAFLATCDHCVFKNLYIHDLSSTGDADSAAFRESNSHHNTFVRNFVKSITAGRYSAAFISEFNTADRSSVFAYNTVVDVGNVTRSEYGTVTASNNICYNIRGNTGSTAVFAGSTYTDNNLCCGYQSKYDSSVTGRGDIWDRDPLLQTDNFYYLTESSPAVDAGNDTDILTANGLTYNYGAPDLGCYESDYSVYCYISGTVTDHAFANVQPGITVTIGNETAVTDSDGKYEIVIAKAPSYSVTATGGEYPYSGTVNASETVVTRNIVIPNCCSVTGRITSAYDGTPVSGCLVYVGYNAAGSNSDGIYRVTRRREDATYPVTVSSGGFLYSFGEVNVSGVSVAMDMVLPDIFVISGTVTSTFTGGPLAGAAVTVGDITYTTGSDGKYEITLRREYSYNFRVVAEGGLKYSETLNVPTTITELTKDVTLSDVCKVYGYVVSDADEAPVEGAVVAVDDVTTTTDADGYFEMNVQSLGTRDFTVAAEGYLTYHGTVKTNQSSCYKGVTLNHGCLVTGVVTSAEDGEPVVGAAVSLGETESVTDKFGGFEAEVPNSDSVAVTVAAEGYCSYSGTVDASGATASVNITLDVNPNCVISGTIIDFFSGDNMVFLPVTVKIGGTKANIDNTGKYTLTLPKAPSYVITASASNGPGTPHYYPYNGTVAADRDAVTKDIFLNKSDKQYCFVEGTVVSVQGTPLEGVKVTEGNTAKYCYTDSGGWYGMTVPRGETVPISVNYEAGGYSGVGKDVNTFEEHIIENFTLRNSIFEYCLASGTVASPEGNPVAGAAVVIEVGFDTYEASADSDGRYEINLPRGAVGAIHVTAQGYATYNGTLNAFGESVVKNIILGGREIDSAGELKNAEVGDIVNVDFKAEALNNSGDFDDNSVYIKSGLFEGYKVIVPAGVTVAKGDTFTFEGSVKFDGEGKYAEAVSVTKASSGGSVRALGMINAMLESNTPVRVWGRVASADNGSYVINNGFENITVFAEKTQMPNVGAFVIVTGIAAPNGVRAIEVL